MWGTPSPTPPAKGGIPPLETHYQLIPLSRKGIMELTGVNVQRENLLLTGYGKKSPHKLTVLGATPHKDCAADVQSDFSSDCIEILKAYCRMLRNFCAR